VESVFGGSCPPRFRSAELDGASDFKLVRGAQCVQLFSASAQNIVVSCTQVVVVLHTKRIDLVAAPMLIAAAVEKETWTAVSGESAAWRRRSTVHHDQKNRTVDRLQGGFRVRGSQCTPQKIFCGQSEHCSFWRWALDKGMPSVRQKNDFFWGWYDCVALNLRYF